MNIFGRAGGFLEPRMGKQILVFLTSLALLFTTWPRSLSAYQDAQAPPQPSQGPPYTQQTPEELQQLVAPIALYPDSLVAQILAASTFPEEVVQADRWVQTHPGLKDQALAQAVDQEPWDPSVKALTAFPSVLGNMDKNLSWTSSLGDAYYNQQQDVMDAVQVMRQKAKQAGTLKSTPQQTVSTEGSTIIVEPANPGVVYIPEYDPWLVYGYPIVAWPGWYPYPGIWYEGPYLSFGIGFGIGFFGGFGWGWGHWGCDWHNRYPIYDHNRYYSRSTTFYNRNYFYRGRGARGEIGARPPAGFRPPSGHVGGPAGGGARPQTGVRPPSGNVGGPGGGGVRPQTGVRPPSGNIGGGGRVYNSPGGTTRPFSGSSQAARGYGAPSSGQSGTRSGAFSGYGQGGQTRGYSSRGSGSIGGGAPRGGGGGTPHGGGGAPAPHGGGHR
jgi:hypothetical protein